MSPTGNDSAGASGAPFWKMSAAGNDFIVLAAGDAPPPEERGDWIRRLCRRRMSVGADGVILVAPAAADRLRVTFYNPDGGETFCGNGARCAARFGRLRRWTPERTHLETTRGLLRAEVDGDRVRVEIGACRADAGPVEIELPDRSFRAVRIEVGVPHLVTFDLDPATTDIDAIGRLLRAHPAAGPDGANVNFVARVAPGRLALRTFERGVEGETLACGTGCVAAVLADARYGSGRSPTLCRTRSGVDLEVEYRMDGSAFEQVTLAGEARLVYSGRLGDGA